MGPQLVGTSLIAAGALLVSAAVGLSRPASATQGHATVGSRMPERARIRTPPQTESPPAPAEGADDWSAEQPGASAGALPAGPFGPRDDAHRQRLATEPVARIRKGGGGRSLAFKITLADGTTGYFKPEQTFSGTQWHAEVASYYLDRVLGLGRVPPTVGRRLPWEWLRRVAEGDPRLDEIVVGSDGTVRGAFVWWIPEPIPPLAPGAHWERWVRVAGAVDVSPLVAPYEWRRAVRAGRGQHSGALQEPDRTERPAELSDMILFDYLTHNLDRWGSEFANVRTRRPGGPLIYLDNAAGFFPGQHRIGLMDARLHVVQRFRRATVDAIRNFDLAQLAQALASDPLAPVLDARLLEGLEVRRRHLLAHVAEMQRRFGDDALPW
jgi:hypothetical protein